MEEESKRRNIPAWAWVLGCLGLLTVCAVIFALGAAVYGFFAVTGSQGDIAPVVAALEAAASATDESEAIEPSAEASAPAEPQTSAPAASASPQESPTAGEPEPAASPTGDAAAPEGDAEPEPPTAIPDPFAAERAAIEANIEAIRALEPKEEVAPVTLTQDALRQRLEDDLLQDYGPELAAKDAIAMSAFDFMPADFDLHNFILDLLTEQIAGYYDPETDEFVIIGNDEEFDILEQVAYAHEYVHALQDQHYNLELLGDDDLESEAAFAVQALAEGEATFVQTQFMLGGYFDAGQLLELVEKSLSVDTAILDSAPPVIASELQFPYLTGLEFIQALYAQGGYDAVDAAWSNLPQSTEHILHPQRYLNGDAPQLVSVAPLTDTLGAGWEMVDEDTLGEFYLREYLLQQLDGDAVDQAATGWGGDRYIVYWNESEQALVMVLKQTWDTPADAEEFSRLYPQYPEGLYGSGAQSQADGRLCWSGGDVICLVASGQETLVVRAPDLETAARVTAVQQFGG